jgi:hypothetical protein
VRVALLETYPGVVELEGEDLVFDPQAEDFTAEILIGLDCHLRVLEDLHNPLGGLVTGFSGKAEPASDRKDDPG